MVTIIVIITVIIIQLETQESSPTKSLPITHANPVPQRKLSGSCMFSTDQGQKGESEEWSLGPPGEQWPLENRGCEQGGAIPREGSTNLAGDSFS